MPPKCTCRGALHRPSRCSPLVPCAISPASVHIYEGSQYVGTVCLCSATKHRLLQKTWCMQPCIWPWPLAVDTISTNSKAGACGVLPCFAFLALHFVLAAPLLTCYPHCTFHTPCPLFHSCPSEVLYQRISRASAGADGDGNALPPLTADTPGVINSIGYTYLLSVSG